MPHSLSAHLSTKVIHMSLSDNKKHLQPSTCQHPKPWTAQFSPKIIKEKDNNEELVKNMFFKLSPRLLASKFQRNMDTQENPLRFSSWNKWKQYTKPSVCLLYAHNHVSVNWGPLWLTHQSHIAMGLNLAAHQNYLGNSKNKQKPWWSAPSFRIFKKIFTYLAALGS